MTVADIDAAIAEVDRKLAALIGNEREQNRIINPLLDERNRLVAARQIKETLQ